MLVGFLQTKFNTVILTSLSNELLNVYYLYKSDVEIWDALVSKYVIEDVGVKKYAIGNFFNIKMSEDKDVSVKFIHCIFLSGINK